MRIDIWGNSSTCPHCIQLKEFLENSNVEFNYYDLSSADVARRLKYKKSLMLKSVSSIPYIEIQGHEPMIGFTKEIKEKLTEILKIGIDG